MAVLESNDNNFQDDVLKASGLVMVDFWAEWCGPCKMLLPVMQEVAAERQDVLKVVKINIDENPEAPSKYGIRSIPTVILFKNGEVLDTKIGANSKSTYLEWVDSYA